MYVIRLRSHDVKYNLTLNIDTALNMFVHDVVSIVGGLVKTKLPHEIKVFHNLIVQRFALGSIVFVRNNAIETAECITTRVGQNTDGRMLIDQFNGTLTMK